MEKATAERKRFSDHKIPLGTSIIIAVATLAAGLFLGINWNYIAGNFLPYLGFKKSAATIDWSSLNEVYTALSANYDGELDQTELISGAKKGMVEAIGDKYTVYMTASEASDFNKSLHGEVGAGIGVELGIREGYPKVLRTLPDNPARKAGILAGDIIYKINDQEVYNLDADKIAELLRGDPGAQVSVTTVRDGEEHNYTLTREVLNNVSADVTYKDNTAIIKITRFDTDTGTIVQNIAKDFDKKGINKVILDLRGNGGGYVSAARDLLSLWLDGDKVVTQKSTKSSDQDTYSKRGIATLKDMETIVLVNGSTASASEIVAGALKDYNKATIIGEQTYGKGVVQTLLNLSAGTQLKVTTARWYSPLGTSIDQTGITPDIVVERSYADINADRDPQLDAALKQ